MTISMLAGITEIWTQWAWPIILFLLGLNLVVFVHELGHYMAARWAGVTVERFALGMGPRLFGVTFKGTDHCLCLLPIGGYVKMAGQEDFGEVEEEATTDPGSFLTKSVPKRLVIISAGVVMNVILAAILFVILSMVGMDFPAPVVGQVEPGSPAADAKITWDGQTPPAETLAGKTGLQPGDTIVSINDEPVAQFLDIKMPVVLSDTRNGELLDIVFERTIGGKTYRGQVSTKPRFNPQTGTPTLGVAPATSLVVSASKEPGADPAIPAGATIVAVNGQPVKHAWELKNFGQNGQPVEVTWRDESDKEHTTQIQPVLYERSRRIYKTDGTWLIGTVLLTTNDDSQSFPFGGKDIDVPANSIALRINGEVKIFPLDEISQSSRKSYLDILGILPRITIAQVLPGSPAEKAGLKKDDIIIRYGDQATPTTHQLNQISRTRVGQKTSLTVLRDGKPITVSVTPVEKGKQVLVGMLPLYDTHAVVGSIRKNSPAAKAGLVAEAELKAINNKPVHNWIDLVEALKKSAGKKVVVTAQIGQKTKQFTLSEKLTVEQFDPKAYQYSVLNYTAFDELKVTIQHTNPMKALAWGGRETWRQILGAYSTLRALKNRTVSTDQVRGPLGIGEIAVMTAREGIIKLVYLMAIISASVAVMNFLPLPVLDGGHAVLLIIEGIRRKPLPLKVINFIQVVGLVLILGLFALLMWQDIARMLDNLW